MIVDKLLYLSEAQALTASAQSTNYIDQLAAGDVLGDGDVFLVVRVGTALTGGVSLIVRILTDDDPAFGSPATVFFSPSLVPASLTANTNICVIRLPLGLERYMAVSYVINGPFAAGTVDAYIVTGIDRKMP